MHVDQLDRRLRGAGVVGGLSHPVWTDTRTQLDPFSGCRTGRAMEEVFTATITQKP